MKRRAPLWLALLLLVSAGCASSPDWIESTLVTVDVTGTWRGDVAVGGGGGASYELALYQQGPRVKGSMRRDGVIPGGTSSGSLSGPIDGTVAGDVFSFKQTDGPLTGQMTVNGDEMTGEVSFVVVRTVTLRRVSASSRPGSQQP